MSFLGQARIAQAQLVEQGSACGPTISALEIGVGVTRQRNG